MIYTILARGDKKVKKGRNEVRFFSKRAMNNLRAENSEIKFIGKTQLKKITTKNEYKAGFLLCFSETGNLFYMGNYRGKGLIKGYFQVSENEFIEYHFRFLPILVFSIIFLVLFIFYFVKVGENIRMKEYERPPIHESGKWDGIIYQSGNKQDFKEERIEIPGYHELYVSIDEPYIILGNPQENTALFKYEVLNGNDLIYESNYIEPGTKLNWNAYDDLSEGEYNLFFVVSTVDEKSYYPCNGASLSVLLHVK